MAIDEPFFHQQLRRIFAIDELLLLHRIRRMIVHNDGKKRCRLIVQRELAMRNRGVEENAVSGIQLDGTSPDDYTDSSRHNKVKLLSSVRYGRDCRIHIGI